MTELAAIQAWLLQSTGNWIMSSSLRNVLALLILSASPSWAQVPRASLDAAHGEHQIVANGVRLWYRVAGSGVPDVAPVVFLHGGPGQGSHHFEALVGPAMESSLTMV